MLARYVAFRRTQVMVASDAGPHMMEICPAALQLTFCQSHAEALPPDVQPLMLFAILYDSQLSTWRVKFNSTFPVAGTHQGCVPADPNRSKIQCLEAPH